MGSSGGGGYDTAALQANQATQQAQMMQFMKEMQGAQLAYENKVLADQEAAAKQVQTDQRNAISASDTAAALQAGQQSEQQAKQALATQGQAQAVTDAASQAAFNQSSNINAAAQTGAGGYNIPAAQQSASAMLAGAAGSIPGTQSNVAGQQPTKNPVASAIAGTASSANPTNATSQSNSLFPNLNGIETTKFGG